MSEGTSFTVQAKQWGEGIVITRTFKVKPSEMTFCHGMQRQVKQVQYGKRSLQITVIQNESLQKFGLATRSIERQFSQLASQWQAETALLSALSQKVLHPSYQRIIGMGEPVVPLLLQELNREPNHWFWALKAITGANPIKPEHRGRIKHMAKDWLDWGRDHGYCK